MRSFRQGNRGRECGLAVRSCTWVEQVVALRVGHELGQLREVLA